MNHLLTRSINKAWQLSTASAVVRFHLAVKNPEHTQRKILLQLLKQNAETKIGRQYNFGSLKSVEAFQYHVPLMDYEDHKQWINDAANGESAVLTQDEVCAFLPTSGTTCGSKIIPWTKSLQHEFKEAVGPWIHGFMQDCPAAWHGSAYWSISPHSLTEAKTSSGIKIGFASDTSYLGKNLDYLLSPVMAVPSKVAMLKDATNWQYVTLAFLLRARNLSLISIWSPTFLSTLLEPLIEWFPSLLSDLESGTLTPPNAVEVKKIHELSRLLGRHTRRACELRKIKSTETPSFLKIIWPKLAAISCWKNAAAQEPARQLSTMFPCTRIAGKGLVATEGIVSIPLPYANSPALAVTSHFYEFLDKNGHVYPAWDLKMDKTYSVVLTTGGGLYRYRLHDIIQIVGFYEKCPLIEFVGRDGVASDMCGEKLSEPFVRACLDRASLITGKIWSFALLAPATNSLPRRYSLFLTLESEYSLVDCDLIEKVVDEALCENYYYAHARRIGQLGSVQVKPLHYKNSWAWSQYQKRLSEEGMRVGDIKPYALDPRTEWESYFEINRTSSESLKA